MITRNNTNYGVISVIDYEEKVLRDYISDNLSEYIIPSGVRTLISYRFYARRNLYRIDIPATVTSMGSSVFGSCNNLAVMICRAELPPTIASSTLPTNATNMRIYVPRDSVNIYKTAANWSKFADVIMKISDDI